MNPDKKEVPVPFSERSEIYQLLEAEAKSKGIWNYTKDNSETLFTLASLYSKNDSSSKVEDHNNGYAFARALLTCLILITLYLLIFYFEEPIKWGASIALTAACWYRAKERAYYYAREVLRVYLKSKVVTTS